MREIKFRAWDKHNKEMVRVTTIDWKGGLIEEINTETYCHGLGALPEKTCILMQFTGLKDKNGKEIYEGDLIKEKYRIKGREVAFGECECNGEYPAYGFYLRDDKYSHELLGGWDMSHNEVIGNLYETPELLYK